MVATEDKAVSVCDVPPFLRDKQSMELNQSFGISCYPPITEPSIQWNHVDGPYMTCMNGDLVWLSFWDRLMHVLGWTNKYELDRKYRGRK